MRDERMRYRLKWSCINLWQTFDTALLLLCEIGSANLVFCCRLFFWKKMPYFHHFVAESSTSTMTNKCCNTLGGNNNGELTTTRNFNCCSTYTRLWFTFLHSSCGSAQLGSKGKPINLFYFFMKKFCVKQIEFGVLTSESCSLFWWLKSKEFFVCFDNSLAPVSSSHTHFFFSLVPVPNPRELWWKCNNISRFLNSSLAEAHETKRDTWSYNCQFGVPKKIRRQLIGWRVTEKFMNASDLFIWCIALHGRGWPWNNSYIVNGSFLYEKTSCFFCPSSLLFSHIKKPHEALLCKNTHLICIV